MQAFVNNASYLVLRRCGVMQVDPTLLGEGLHYGEVQAFDKNARWRGPLFRYSILFVSRMLIMTLHLKAQLHVTVKSCII